MHRGLGAVLIGVMAVAAMAIATGCGDSSESSEAALTKSQYLKQGNAICEKAVVKKDKDTKAAVDKALKNKDPSEFTKEEQELVIVNVALPPVQTGIEELADLGVPEGDDDVVNSFIEGYEEALDTASEDPGSLLKQPDPFDKPNKEAENYGLERCSAIS